MKRILVTGGVGFIGSHLYDELLQRGYEVRVLDNLSVQVHGLYAQIPTYLNPELDFRLGDLRDPEAVRRALDGIDTVFRLTAGTAVLLKQLVERPVERLIVASNVNIWDSAGNKYSNVERTAAQLKQNQWEMRSPQTDEQLTPVPTPEWKSPSLASVYASNKFDQERLCMKTGQAYGTDTSALRFLNVYDPHQALSDTNTGACAIFAPRLLNGHARSFFEDGNQLRDFVSVHGGARACRLTPETPAAAGKVFNVGSGRRYRIRDVAASIARVFGKPAIEPDIKGSYSFPDISVARTVLGFEPEVALEDGLVELAGQVAEDCRSEAHAELAARGLVV